MTPTLIVEPNQQMAQPYCHLPNSYDITRVTSLETAFEQLIDNIPSLVILSTSYSKHKLLDFMSEVQMSSRLQLIPLILVIDLDQRLNFVPGTFWAGKLGLWHSLSSEEEVIATLNRVTKQDVVD